MRRLAFKLCAIVVTIAAIVPNACRGDWYQPEEPEGLKKFLGKAQKQASYWNIHLVSEKKCVDMFDTSTHEIRK